MNLSTTKEILLVFPPGARGNFLNAFLTDSIDRPSFEFNGATCIHTWQLKLENNSFVRYAHKNFSKHQIGDDCFIVDRYDINQYTKIFIDLDRPKLDRWLYVLYTKNILDQDISYNNLLDEKTFDKLYSSVLYELDLCKNTNKTVFDYVVPFSKLYEWDYLQSLYFKINNVYSNKKEIVEQTNILNDISNIHFKTVVDLALATDPNEVLPYRLFDRYLETVNRSISSNN